MTEADHMRDPAERPAQDVEPERPDAPSDGVPQDLPDGPDAEDGHAT